MPHSPTVLMFSIGMILGSLTLAAHADSAATDPAPKSWRADHHMHLASPDLCARVGECLDSHTPPAVYAADAVRALDEAGVGKGLVLSCAYLYGLRSLALPAEEVALRVRQENEFTAAEVAKYPERLVGFLSVDPLQTSALDELAHWKGSRTLVGLKLHFEASGVNLNRAVDRARVSQIIAAAAEQQLPMVLHVGGERFGPAEADLLISQVLPSAGASWVQIAHAGGGAPMDAEVHAGVLRVFANHIEAEDPVLRRVLFDLSFVPLPGNEGQAAANARLVVEMRRIGIERFLFASDFNVQSPVESVVRLRALGLGEGEVEKIAEGCARWVCR